MSTHRLARKSAVPLAVFLCGAAVLAQGTGVITRPPVARKTPHETKIHGYTLKDDYFWLREKTNPEVIAYLEAENAYTERGDEADQGLQETLYKEMLGRIKQTDLSVPRARATTTTTHAPRKANSIRTAAAGRGA